MQTVNIRVLVRPAAHRLCHGLAVEVSTPCLLLYHVLLFKCNGNNTFILQISTCMLVYICICGCLHGACMPGPCNCRGLNLTDGSSGTISAWPSMSYERTLSYSACHTKHRRAGRCCLFPALLITNNQHHYCDAMQRVLAGVLGGSSRCLACDSTPAAALLCRLFSSQAAVRRPRDPHSHRLKQTCNPECFLQTAQSSSQPSPSSSQEVQSASSPIYVACVLERLPVRYKTVSGPEDA